MASINVSVRLSDGSKMDVSAVSDGTVLDLKKVIETKHTPPVTPDRQKIVFKGRILKDEDLLSACGVEEGTAVHLVVSKAATAASPAPAPAAAAPSATSTGAAARPMNSPGMGVGMGMGMGMGAGGGDFMGMAQQMMGNPNQMASLMENPMVQNMLGDQNFMEQILRSNPETARLLESNPEVARMFRDPDLMQQAMRAATNPEYQRELMRSNDRAMANIEAIPGGFNALARMHHDIAAPLEEGLRDALTGGPDRTGQQDGGRTQAQAGPTADAMPNPWGRPSGAAAPGSAGMAGNPFAAMMGGMGGMPGGMGGGDPMAAMMNNPAMMQMAVQMLSQPGFLEMMEASNPMLQQMFAANPQMRDMMRNPQFLQMAMNPQTMQMMQAMGGMGGMGGLGGMAGMPGAAPQAGSPPATGGLPGSAPNPMANMAMLQAMMGGMGGMPGGMGGMGGMPAAPADTRPPAERFASQLTQMREMGFTDDEQNIRALSASGGNVQFAVERILDGRA